MITPIQIYLLSRLDNIRILLLAIVIIAPISIFILLASCIIRVMDSCGDLSFKDCFKDVKPYFKTVFIAFLLSSVLLCLMPTTDEMTAMYLAQRIQNKAKK